MTLWTAEFLQALSVSGLADYRSAGADWSDPAHAIVERACSDEDGWQAEVGKALVAIAGGQLSVTLPQGTALLHAAMDVYFCDRHGSGNRVSDCAAIRAIGPSMIAIFDPDDGPGAPRVLSAGRTESDLGDLAARFANYVCYMFWDVAPYPYICSPDGASACLDAMEACARSTHPGLVESGLHGLGHARDCGAVASMEARRIEIIARANTAIPGFQSALRQYADAAMTGMVQ